VSNEFPKYILIQATETNPNPISIARLYPILGKKDAIKKETIVIGNP
jgi:hypothetical protein